MKHNKEALVASWKRRSCQDLKAAKILTGEGGMRETRYSFRSDSDATMQSAKRDFTPWRVLFIKRILGLKRDV